MKTLAGRVLCCCAVWSTTAAPAPAQPAPHAVHGGRLGGAFATAAADTLHVEAMWSEQRRLRLFVTDASGGLLPIERLRELSGSALAASRETPLVLLEAESYFEARIPTLTMPAEIIVRLTPSPAASEDRLTFTFSNYSPDVLGTGGSPPVEIPETLAGILSALADDRQAARAVIDRGDFLALLGFEDRVRDLVLAIEAHLAPLPDAARIKAQAAITSVVRACWLLHTVLDYGTADQRAAVFTQLGEALDRTVAAVAGIAR